MMRLRWASEGVHKTIEKRVDGGLSRKTPACFISLHLGLILDQHEIYYRLRRKHCFYKIALMPPANASTECEGATNQETAEITCNPQNTMPEHMQQDAYFFRANIRGAEARGLQNLVKAALF